MMSNGKGMLWSKALLDCGRVSRGVCRMHGAFCAVRTAFALIQSGEALGGDPGIAEHRDSQRYIVCAPAVCGNGAGKADGIQVVGASLDSFFTLL